MGRFCARRTAWAIGLATIAGFGAGCTGFIDRVTSRDFRVRDMFVDPDPMTVLRTSTDGDARARAMKNLKEPSKTEANAELQNEAVGYLIQSATSDPRPLCRLAAIEALGRFDDPRTGPALLTAYQEASKFSTDIANPIRCEAMASLGKKDLAEGFALLTRVATTQRDNSTSTIKRAGFEGDEELTKLLGHYDPDAQSARDGRLAAIRALATTKNTKAIPVLIGLMNDTDVAVRDRAHEALRTLSGRRDVANSHDAWQQALGVAPAATSK